MRFTDLNLFGVYVAPIVPMMIGAAVVLSLILHGIDRLGRMPRAWHPALFHMALYVAILSLIVIIKGGM